MHSTMMRAICSTHMTRWMSSGCAALCCLGGCGDSPQTTEPIPRVIELGRGAPNRCAIGMHVSEICRKMPGTTIHNLPRSLWVGQQSEKSRFLSVPSLGAIGVVEPDGTVSHLEFHMRSYTNSAMRELAVRTPFCGNLGGKLEFAGRDVRKMDVEAAFGKLIRGSTNALDYATFRRVGQPFWIAAGEGREELWYEAQGVTFVLCSNSVVSFSIYPAPGTIRPAGAHAEAGARP
jgi:hypothetical protein